MLQPVEERRGLRHAAVTDVRTAAELQAGEGPAVAGHSQQTGIGDFGQRGQRETLEVCEAHHLRMEDANNDIIF